MRVLDTRVSVNLFNVQTALDDYFHNGDQPGEEIRGLSVKNVRATRDPIFHGTLVSYTGNYNGVSLDELDRDSREIKFIHKTIMVIVEHIKLKEDKANEFVRKTI